MTQRTGRRPRPPVHAATVSAVHDLSPRVRCIRFDAEALRGSDWVPGQKVKIKGADWLRSYTPSRVDSAEGWMDVIFFLHGNGLASRWAAQASPGEALHYVGPSKSMAGPERVPDWALFMGDETTIGLAAALIEALPDSVRVIGAIEVDAVDSSAMEAYGVPLAAAIRRDEHGDALLAWLEALELPAGHGMVWVSGEVISVRALKDAMMERNPESVEFKMKAYWSRRGHAHRKALEKQ